MDLRLKGKAVLITGGSKGIGLACAKAFAAEGCRVHLAARDKDRLAQAAKTLSAEVKTHSVDLRDGAALRQLAKDCGDVDILVNNAGDIPGGTIETVDEAKWRHAWELKVFGFINLTREIYPRMKARKAGVIVNVIGMAGDSHPFEYVCGAAANAGLAGSTKALVFQLASLTDAHWTMSGEVVLMTLLGGLGTIFGPVVGAFVVLAMENYLAQLGFWVTIVQGAIFVVCVLTFRRGVIGELARLIRRPL